MTQKSPNSLRDEIILEIHQAFDGVTREDGVSLHEAKVIDDYGSDKERAHARIFDTDTRWQDVPDRDIEDNDSILSFLDPIGFRYYMAAYMSWSLKFFMKSGSCTSDFTIYALKPSSEDDLKRWSLERYSLFTQSQARAICRFLRYMAWQHEDFVDTDQARSALEIYWGKFCDTDK